jgi:acetyltransferase-like isoleucine patch superfamily enzyme
MSRGSAGARASAAVAAAKDKVLDRLAASVARRAAPMLGAELLKHHTVFGHAKRLHLAPTAVVNNAIFNTVSGEIVIGEWVMIAHNCYLATGEHDITKFNEERHITAPYYDWDIVVEEGAWLATGVVVLGPCRIGRHAVVAAGSLVRSDVPAYAVFAGVPARQVASVPHPEHDG